MIYDRSKIADHEATTSASLEEESKQADTMSALDTQVGGGHYKDLAIQPIQFIHANSLGYIEGCVVKYITRWRNKNGVEDLEKIKHYIDLLIALEDEDNERSVINTVS